jgi:unsaturated rhamnogalacturonyl hydrolase
MITGACLRDVASRAADRLLPHPWKMWFWGDSIGLEGLLDASELTGDQKYFGYVYALIKGWIARERNRSEFDYTAPGVALLRLLRRTSDPGLREAALRHADYMAGFRRTRCGAYVRYENAHIERPPEMPGGCASLPLHGPESNGGGPCIFVDSVHFDGPFFAALHSLTGDRRYRDLAVENILSQLDLLYEPSERLFHHFWIERTEKPNGILWARGNGWGLLGVALVLEELGCADPENQRLSRVLRDGIVRLAELQDASGAWHTILTDPGSYVETSTAAFYVDIICRAIRLGLVEEGKYAAVIDSAMQYLLRHVAADGALEGVSYETFPSTRAEHYRSMPRGAVVPWGQGPLLAAFRSYAGLYLPGEFESRVSEPTNAA